MNQTILDQIRKGNIEVTESGILLPVMKAKLAGKWRVRKNDEEWDVVHNIVTTEGATAMLDSMFNGAASLNWYVGIYSGVVTPAVGDTAAVLTSKYEQNTAYVNATRPGWDSAAAASGSVTDTTVAEFVANQDDQTIYGAFLASSEVRTSTTGVLFSAANFTSGKPLSSGDQLSVGYTITAQDVTVA